MAYTKRRAPARKTYTKKTTARRPATKRKAVRKSSGARAQTVKIVIEHAQGGGLQAHMQERGLAQSAIRKAMF